MWRVFVLVQERQSFGRTDPHVARAAEIAAFAFCREQHFFFGRHRAQGQFLAGFTGSNGISNSRADQLKIFLVKVAVSLTIYEADLQEQRLLGRVAAEVESAAVLRSSV